ncbi:MAG: hypothetical protein ABI459_09015, partial [Deltaproteobacteria bacterium]
MTYGRKILLIVMTVLLVTSCNDATPGHSSLMANRAEKDRGGRDRSGSPFDAFLNGRGGDTRSLGTDDFIQESNGRPLVEPTGKGEFSLNLLNVPIEQAAKAVLGDALQRAYAIQPGVTGNVTIQTTDALSESDLLETFQTILELNALTMQVADNLISIVPLSGAARHVTTLGNAGGVGSRVVAVPLR